MTATTNSGHLPGEMINYEKPKKIQVNNNAESFFSVNDDGTLTEIDKETIYEGVETNNVQNQTSDPLLSSTIL